MKLTLRLFALIGAFAFAPVANAGWTGCYLGAHGGLAASNLNTDLTATGFGSLLNIDGLSASGGMYGVHAGCDYKMNQFVIGAFADYSWYDADFNISSPLGGFAILNTGLDSSWSIGGRAGMLVSKSTLVYGLVAWSQMDMNPITTLGGLGPTLTLGSTDGTAVGGGIETELMPNVRLKLEYRYSMYDKIVSPIGPGLSLDMEPDVHTVRLGVSYAFTLGGSD